MLQVRIKDHREAIGDFAALVLTIEGILISPKPGLLFWRVGWKNLVPGPQALDLTKYTGKESAGIFRGGIDAGAFDAVHLKIAEVKGLLNKDRRNAPVKNLIRPVKMPFEIRRQAETTIIFDLVVLDLTDHPPRGYELAIKGYEIYMDGKLIGKVPPA